MKLVIIIAIAFVCSILIFSVGLTPQSFGWGGKEPDKRVCGDRLCSEISGGRDAWENKAIIPSTIKNESSMTSLKTQIKNGVSPDSITCNEELVLIIRHNGSPACVKPQTAEKLEQRSWGVMPPPCCKNMHLELKESISISAQELEESINISAQECSGTARCITGTVTKIIDGDTIHVDGQKIRFALAAAPELGSYGSGVEATEFIQKICPVGSEVLVDEDDGQTQGSYGRIIGVIYCNGMNLNSELLDADLGNIEFRSCDISEFGNTDWAIKHGC